MTTKATTKAAEKSATNSSLLLCQLTALFAKAKAAAIAADPGEGGDGGTCNLDSPAFRIERGRREIIEAAAEAAGVSVYEFSWFGGRKWFWLNVPMHGQADRRHKMARAASAVLRAAADAGTVPGLSACMYCQMD